MQVPRPGRGHDVRACVLVALTSILAAALAGCGAPGTQAAIRLPPDERPIAVGRGSAYRLRAVPPAVARKAVLAGLRCGAKHRRSYGVHLELFAKRLVLPVPAGIGIGPPQRRSGVYVLGGTCQYPVRTFEPTGVLVVEMGRTVTLGQLFALWGQPLSAAELAGFGGRVLAFVGGIAWRRAPQAMPLRPHAEIVLEVGGYILPHPSYRFPPGL